MKEGPDTEDVIQLTQRLISEARVRAEDEQRSAAPVRGLSRVIMVIAILGTMSAGIATVYGIIWMPGDIPIRRSGEVYVGKTGKTHTRDDFERYETWSRAMFTTYPASIALWFLFAGLRKRDRRT